MKQPDLYYFEIIQMTLQAQSNFVWYLYGLGLQRHTNDVASLVKFCVEITSRRRVFSVNFDQACDVIF